MDPRDIYSLEQFHPSKITRPGRASPHNESQNIRRHQKRARNEAVPVGSEGRQPASTETIRAIQTPIRITRRTATACDRCYQGHRKCETADGLAATEETPCRNCAIKGQLCTFARRTNPVWGVRPKLTNPSLPPFSVLDRSEPFPKELKLDLDELNSFTISDSLFIADDSFRAPDVWSQRKRRISVMSHQEPMILPQFFSSQSLVDMTETNTASPRITHGLDHRSLAESFLSKGILQVEGIESVHMPYEPYIGAAIPNGAEAFTAQEDVQESTFEVYLPTELMRKVLCRFESVKRRLNIMEGHTFELGVGYDCIPGAEDYSGVPGDTEALWIQMLSPVAPLLMTQRSIEGLAYELECPIFVVNPDSQLLLSIRPEVVSWHTLNKCFSCQRIGVQVALAPIFTGCNQSPVIWNRPFHCGQYCWECLTKDLRERALGIGDCYRCPPCNEPLPVWAVELCFPEPDVSKCQEHCLAKEAVKNVRKCDDPSCWEIIPLGKQCRACETLSIMHPFDPNVISPELDSGNSTRSKNNTGQDTQAPTSGGSSSTSQSSPTSESRGPENGLRSTNPNGTGGNRFQRGQGDDDDPYQQAKSDGIPDEPPQSSGGEFVGTAILSDKFGWQQKIYMSYNLLVSPEHDIQDDTASRVSTRFAVDTIEVTVARAIFEEKRRCPQFRICRAMISVDPNIESHPPKPSD